MCLVHPSRGLVLITMRTLHEWDFFDLASCALVVQDYLTSRTLGPMLLLQVFNRRGALSTNKASVSCGFIAAPFDLDKGALRLTPVVSNERLCHFLLMVAYTTLGIAFIITEVADVLIDQLRFLIIFVSIFEDLGVLTYLDK